MSKKKLLGIEIGNLKLKIAVCTDYVLDEMILADIPDNLVRGDEIVSWDAMAEFIKETLKEHKITAKNAAVAIPEKMVYTKRVVMPLMTCDQLKVNLPYEFHDYITEDKDKYFYDYAVIGKTDEELDLIAVAAQKELVSRYKNMLRRAGLKLVLIAPDYSALRNIIKDYEDVNHIEEKRDYAVLDLGHRAAKIYFFPEGEYEITRVMDMGGESIDRHIAATRDIDIHTAKMYKEANMDNVLRDEICTEVYNQMAIEVMRVLNFYNFNHPGNNLDTLYYTGGGSMVEPLLEAIREVNEIPLVSIRELLTDEYADEDAVMIGLYALGIVWE